MIYLVPDQIEGLCSDQQASCHRTTLLHETSAICLTTVSLMRIAGFCFPKAQGKKVVSPYKNEMTRTSQLFL